MKCFPINFRILACCLPFVFYSIPFLTQPAYGEKPRSILPSKPFDLTTSPKSLSNNQTPKAKTKRATPDPLKSFSKSKETLKLDGKFGIEVNRLNVVEIENIGILDTNTGGFPPNVWRDTPREIIKNLIEFIPAETNSETLRILRRRLLLSAVSTPPSKEKGEQTILLARANALFRTGDLKAVSQLLDLVPRSVKKEPLSKLAADAAFLQNDLDHACSMAADWVLRSQDRYWQKALIFCEALNEAWARVDFGMRLLIELGDQDEVFFTLMRGISGEANIKIQVNVSALRPLDIAMLRGARYVLPEFNDKSLAPWLLQSYIQNSSVPLQTRVTLAEKAERLGLINSVELAKLYNAIPLTSELLDNAVSAALNDSGFKGRALMYRATQAQPTTYAQAQAIQQAQKIAYGNGFFQQMARLYEPIIRTIPVNTQLSWFAIDAALLNCSNGDIDAAARWLVHAKLEADLDSEAKERWVQAWPLIRMMSGDRLVAWDNERITDWWDLTQRNEPKLAYQKAMLLFGLLTALGDEIPLQLWRGLIRKPKTEENFYPGHASNYLLKMARKKNNIGEALALIILAFGSKDVEALSTTDLVRYVENLNSMGLVSEARKLAFEISTEKGL